MEGLNFDNVAGFCCHAKLTTHTLANYNQTHRSQLTGLSFSTLNVVKQFHINQNQTRKGGN